MGLACVLWTWPRPSIFSPPKVNVMPHVTAKPWYGGVSMGRAQLDLGGAMPCVCTPSSAVGS